MDVDREEVERILRAIEAARNAPPPPPMTLASYVASLDGVPMPTAEQRESFAEFVSTAHSWYKHLPRFLPGAPFRFFLDRHAGCDLAVAEDGSATMVARSEQGFHYSAIPTEDYRRQYGHLAYATSAGRVVVPVAPGPVKLPIEDRSVVDDEQEEPRGLPVEIQRVGGISLTAVIHPRSAFFGYWHLRVEGKEIAWPEESGGRETLRKILERSRWMDDPANLAELQEGRRQRLERRLQLPDSRRSWDSDDELFDLLAPERNRQLREMVAAMDRVCGLIEQHRA